MDGSEKRPKHKQQTLLRRPVGKPQTIVMYAPQEEIEQPATSYSSGQIITMSDDGNHYVIAEDMLAQAGMIGDNNVLYVADDGNAVAMSDLIEEDDSQGYTESLHDQPTEFVDSEVITEEIITDDWVQQSQDGDCVEVTVAQITENAAPAEDEEDITLPTDQDEYTTSRPYPCDFCSRRFRKKANLQNHMVAHQNDRPHVCNLCGARYIRKCDLLNHLKIHAYIPDEHELNETGGLEEYPDNLAEQEYELEMLMSGYSRSLVAAKQAKKKQPAVVAKGNNRKKVAVAPQKIIPDYSDGEAEQTEPVVEKYPVTDPRKPFVCQQCGVGFTREKALSSHVKIHGDATVECELCGDIFLTQAQLQAHNRKHHRDQSDSDYNVYEDENEDTEEEDETRRRKSGKPELSSFYCDQCGMGFHRNDLLRKHYKTHTKPAATAMGQAYDEDGDETDDANDVGLHCCNTCGETFSEALDLLAHAEVHARFQPFKCNLCGVNFDDEDQIKLHIQHMHQHELTETSCRLCGKQCKDGRALMKHAWDHSTEKAHSCSKCGKTFHNKARLKRHMISHRDKAVICEICHEEFADGRTLSNHRHYHTKTNQFSCTECGKTFGSRSSQQIHIRIHTGEKPYGCRFCWKAFADGGTLRKHERIHTGEKPYACSVCPRAFNQRVVLREHIRSHHSTADSKHGNSVTPYYCVVCSSLFATSAELIKHLVAHSDANTQARRKPVTGPRKYKRRRKLKPHEMDELQKARDTGKPNQMMLGYSDDEIKPGMLDRYRRDDGSSEEDGMLNDEDLLIQANELPRKRIKTEAKAGKGPPKMMVELTSCINPDDNDHIENLLADDVMDIKPRISKADKCISLTATDAFDVILEAARNQIGGVVTQPSKAGRRPAATSSSGRPKMIHTEKTRVAVTDGKRKTKTLITKEVVGAQRGVGKGKTKPVVVEEPTVEESGEETEEELVQPPPVEKPAPSATRRSARTAASTATSQDDFLLMEMSKKNQYMDKFNSDIVNDLEEILRSPIKATGSKGQSPATASKLAVGSRQSARTATRTANATVTSPETPTRSGGGGAQKRQVVVVTKPLIPKKIENIREMTELPMKIMDIKQEEDGDDMIGDLERAVANNPYKCEMCSASFSDRGQLLLHVPIHI